jgi:hypothetical protein
MVTVNDTPRVDPQDLDALERQTKDYYETRGPTVFPMDDVIKGMERVVTEEFGKRAIPTDIPQVYQDLIKDLRKDTQELANSLIVAVRAAQDLEDDIVSRCRAHEEYTKREAKIAQKFKEKYSGIGAAIRAEIEAEEKEGGK